MEAAWRADAADLLQALLDRRTVGELLTARDQVEPEAEMARLDRMGVRAIHLRSPDYPELMREIYDPPSVIYMRGDLGPEDGRAIAVVGTRGPTAYGREAARRIDAIAHRAALDAGGRSIAVVGGGLDSIYPAEHAGLARDLAGQGCVLSEYPLGMRARAEHFPRRNRVISGLSLGVVVVEAGMKSGALLTAKHALDQNREVFAVPGGIMSEKSAGTNWLIQQGAKLVTSKEDILEELHIADTAEQLRCGRAYPAAEADGPVEAMVLEALAAGTAPVHVDEITRAAGLDASTAGSALATMELRGAVQQVGPIQYVAARSARPAFRN